jgi:AraC family L-rhamnose operon regulatory protein RhaS
MNGAVYAAAGPTLICLNPRDTCRLLRTSGVSARSIRFSPLFVNVNMTLDRIRSADYAELVNQYDFFSLRPFLHTAGARISCLPLSPNMAERIDRYFIKMKQELRAQNDGLWPCRTRTQLMRIILLTEELYDEYMTTGLPAAHSTDPAVQLTRVLEYIHTNYSEKISLQYLVNIFNLNRTTLNELFRKATGDTVISYLIKLRIELAASMLRDTGMPIKEIGCRVGFDDTANFGRTFKKLKGCSPKQYREENSWILQFC